MNIFNNKKYLFKYKMLELILIFNIISVYTQIINVQINFMSWWESTAELTEQLTRVLSNIQDILKPTFGKSTTFGKY